MPHLSTLRLRGSFLNAGPTVRDVCKESRRLSENSGKMSRENLERNMLGGKMPMLPFSSADEGQGINEALLREYPFFLAGKAEGTIEAYLRTVRQIMIWVAARPGILGTRMVESASSCARQICLQHLCALARRRERPAPKESDARDRSACHTDACATSVVRRPTLYSPFSGRARGRSTRGCALCAGPTSQAAG